MTTANLNITQILMRRGNTAVTSQYVGPIGEIIIDTDLKTLRVQDGITPGGNVIPTNDVVQNIASAAAFQIAQNPVSLHGITFGDGSTQNSAASTYIVNTNHIVGTYVFNGSQRGVSLSSDGTPTNIIDTLVSRDHYGNISVGNLFSTTINTSSITDSSSIGGNLTVYGNLNVKGTTTTFNTASVNTANLFITVANTAISSLAADGAGFKVGNSMVHGEFASLTYSDVNQAWLTTRGIVPTPADSLNFGSAANKWGVAYVDQVIAAQSLQVGATSPGTGTIIQVSGSINGYEQVYNQNTLAGALASADYICGNDITDPGLTVNYVDMGIQSSISDDPKYSFAGNNSSYLYCNGGNLSIATQTPGTDLIFYQGGTTIDKEIARFNLGSLMLNGFGRVSTGNTLQVYGDSYITGNVDIEGNLEVDNNVIANKGTFFGNLITSNLTAMIGGQITGWLRGAAGNTTDPALQLSAGLLQSIPTVGSIEYNGSVFYGTPSGNQRGIIPTEQYFQLGADRIFTPLNEAQYSLFGVGARTTSNTRYHIVLMCSIERNSGSLSPLLLGFGGSAVLAGFSHYTISYCSAGTAFNEIDTTSSFATGIPITQAGALGSDYDFKLFGTIDVLTGGLLIPTIGWLVNPGTVTVHKYSLCRLFPVDSQITNNTVVGAWA